MPVGADRLRACEAFLFEEARLLDGRRFEEWLGLFDEDGVYWIPAAPGQDDPVNEASIAHEGLQLLEVRVRRLRHPGNHADQPPARTRRVIGNVAAEPRGDGRVTVSSNFVVVELQDDAQRVLAGDYVHTLRPEGDGFRISRKRVNLLSCDAPMAPIVVPL